MCNDKIRTWILFFPLFWLPFSENHSYPQNLQQEESFTEAPVFSSPKSQMVFVGIIVLFQVAIAIIWFVFKQPDSVLIPSDYSVDLRFAANVYAGLSVSLTYNGILLACSTFFAFRTRHVPSEFNEAKLIGLCCYTICTIWAVFIPSYFGTCSCPW